MFSHHIILWLKPLLIGAVQCKIVGPFLVYFLEVIITLNACVPSSVRRWLDWLQMFSPIPWEDRIDARGLRRGLRSVFEV